MRSRVRRLVVALAVVGLAAASATSAGAGAGAAVPSTTASVASDPQGTVDLAASDPHGALGVSLSAGRVTWADSQTDRHPIWTRTVRGVSSDGSSVGLGTQTHLLDIGGDPCCTAHFDQGGTSGNRTLWEYDFTDTEFPTYTVNVTDSQHTVGFTREVSPYLAKISGTRAVADHGTSLFDLAHGSQVDATKAYGAVAGDLWGVYLAYAKKDGSIWRKRLASPAPAVEIAGPVEGLPFVTATVVTDGDWVAFTRVYDGGSGRLAHFSGFRNARTLATRTYLSSATVLRANDDGVIVRDSDLSTQLYRWSGASRIELPNDTATTYGPTVAWIAADGSPKIAPLGADVVTRLRSLGNPAAPTSLTLGNTWKFDLPTTDIPTPCSVQIRSMSRHLVRTLPCDASALKLGEIATSWDGRTSTGKKVNPTTVRWGVVAENVYGPMLNVDGTTAVTYGYVKVRHS